MSATYARQGEATEVRVAPRGGADLSDVGANVLAEAMTFCARKLGIGADAVLERLRQGDREACAYCLYGVAVHVAAALGTMDDHVKAVYVLDHDATPEDLCFGTLGESLPVVHMIVWTARKTAALRALLAALDRALAQTYADCVARAEVHSLLDVQTIDDDDVARRRGHGALLYALHQRPVQVWER